MHNGQDTERPEPFGASFHDILGNFLEGCQIISPDLRYLYLNDAAVSHGRIPRDQMLGRTMPEIFPDIENTHMFAVLRKCMTDRTHARMENEFHYPDGSTGWFELSFEPVPEGLLILSIEITERKRIEEEQLMMLEALQLINAAETWEEMLQSLIARLKEWSGCEAVGIRIREGEDYPYYVTTGFSDQFVKLENHLCFYNEDGDILYDTYGKPILECMCGNILRGRFDPSKNFFTDDGCFWSNCTTELLATTTDADRQARTRNRCNGVGYESVALIPLRSGQETFGLIQLNDKRKGRFTLEKIARFRRIADRIANFLARKQAENRVTHLNTVLRGIRNVNQLITREKDRDQLIRKACDLLVESRGFYSVVIGLTDTAGERVLTFAGSGRKLDSMVEMLTRGDVPDCARKAMESSRVTMRRLHNPSCRECPSAVELSEERDNLIIGLEQEGVRYGFMLVSIPGGAGDSSEEQDLLKEVAGDITFALHSMEIERERDKTEAALAATREQLRQVQKLEAIGQLAGGVAHDFNNILMAQIGYCDLMQDELRDEDPLSRDLAEIRAFAERAAALTRQLLAFSRKQALQPEVLDLNGVILNIEKMLKRLIGEDIDFETSLAEELGKVEADPGQIEQVIMNLAVNARDAMPQGGKLTIETSNVILDEEYARSHVGSTAGPHIMMAITDTGCGMDERTRSRLFEPFFTTKGQGKGTGLGLATVYGIIKQSGGNIWVYSETGKGTTFKIYLPCVEGEVIRKERRETGAVRGQGELVMVVEDERALRELFAKMINNLGYRVKIAANGDEALLAVEKEGLRPDLLITDVVMPGMSGKTLVNTIKRMQPELRVLFTSGYTDNAIVHHGVLDPGTPFLQKPFSLSLLAGKIREVLDAE